MLTIPVVTMATPVAAMLMFTEMLEPFILTPEDGVNEKLGEKGEMLNSKENGARGTRGRLLLSSWTGRN